MHQYNFTPGCAPAMISGGVPADCGHALTVATDRAQGLVVERLEILGKLLDEARVASERLASRLEPVLKPIPVGDNLKAGGPGPVVSPLAQMVDSRISQVNELSDRIRSIIERLEV